MPRDVLGLDQFFRESIAEALPNLDEALEFFGCTAAVLQVSGPAFYKLLDICRRDGMIYVPDEYFMVGELKIELVKQH